MESHGFDGLWYDCERLYSDTSKEQCSCEKECANFLVCFETYPPATLEKFRTGSLINEDNEIRLLRSAHATYLTDSLSMLPGGFVSLDASRPWMYYWILHALYLLGKEPMHLYPLVPSSLVAMQSKSGGFCGGPGQLAHCAPTYAAVLALCTCGSDESLAAIDRAGMYDFFMSLKHSSGGFRMHYDGEVDSRGTYTVLAVSRILNIMTPELVEGVADFILSCQTYEGGFGGEPGNEAHGGYNFCAIAGLLILGEGNRCDLDAQEHWLLSRQMKLEGGFQGRTNKLVDACYSFWQGAALAIVNIIRNGGSDIYDLEIYLSSSSSSSSSSAAVDSNGEIGDIDLSEAQRIATAEDRSGELSFNQKALQRYVLHCGQQTDGGGLRDKPGKSRDFYHSCYALSGLSIAQSCNISTDLPGRPDAPQVYGDADNLVKQTSAVFNIGLDKLDRALKYFSAFPNNTHQQLVSECQSQRTRTHDA